MTLYLVNTLGEISDSIKADYIEDIVEGAKEVYKENYSFQFSDANKKVWEVSCMDIYPQEINSQTFKYIV